MSRLQTNAIRHLGSSTDNLTFDNAGRVLMPKQPSFFGYYNGASLGPNSTAQKLDLVVVTNNGGHYASGNFTCPVAGYYYCAFAGASVYGASGAIDISIRKNGSAVSSGYAYSATANEYNASSCSAVIFCAANDTIEFWKNSTSTNSFQQGSSYSSASIMLIG